MRKGVRLNNNKIDELGATRLAIGLRQNNVLEELDVSENYISKNATSLIDLNHKLGERLFVQLSTR